MVQCYLCDCRLKDDYEQCECCVHQFCPKCYRRIENFFISMPDEHRDPIYERNGYNSLICPCSCDDSCYCLTPDQMDDYMSSF